MLSIEVFDFAVVVLILFAERVDDLTLSFDLSLEVFIRLLHHEDFLLLLLLFS